MLKRVYRAARRRGRVLVPERITERGRNLLGSSVYPFQVPLPPDEEKGWKAYPQFKGATRNMNSLSCHVSVLTNGNCPHPPHTHKEEEILMLLSGEADLVLPEHEGSGRDHRMRLRSGEFVYYPAFFPHTLEAVSTEPANYLMLKWHGGDCSTGEPLSFGRFDTNAPEIEKPRANGFHARRLFHGPTAYLRALHCHVTLLEPGGGYDVHVDKHDAVIVMLDGEGETLGQRFRPNSVTLYSAGDLHGMHNPGDRPAHYVVFEFHGDYRPSMWAKIEQFRQH